MTGFIEGSDRQEFGRIVASGAVMKDIHLFDVIYMYETHQHYIER